MLNEVLNEALEDHFRVTGVFTKADPRLSEVWKAQNARIAE
jgi:hypothetical protein